MKKMVIYMPKLSVGGMEKALINLLNFSDLTKMYDIELYLGYVVQKEYLDLIPKSVKVNLCCKGKWNLFGKIIAFYKMNVRRLKAKLGLCKYDVAISYAYQHPILAKLARASSDNNIVFIHSNLKLARTKKQIDVMQFDKFSKVVCVSEDARIAFKELFPNYSGKLITINNYIDGDYIVRLANENVEFDYTKPVFISIARHEEKCKKITRIINAAKKLKEENYKFTVLLIGDGEDHLMYEQMVKENCLEDKVILLGTQVNPYKYLVKSSALVLSSAYEGYGIVIDESRILDVPVISTKVADAEAILNSGYGIICDNSDDGVYSGMKQFLDEDYQIKNKFDYNNFNEEITNKINLFIEE